MGDDYSDRVGELHAKRKKNLGMGGAEKIAKQHEPGKFTVPSASTFSIPYKS